MFDLVTGKAQHTPHHATGPILASAAAQLAVVATLFTASVLVVADQLPTPPVMMAFVAAAPTPPPPPPPPAPAKPKAPTPPEQVPSASPNAAPVEPPREIRPEIPDDEGFDEGVPGGVEGGVPGGVVGGIVGGLPSDIPPPPPPPPPVSRAPVRIGGQLNAPALVHRVEPDYPELAARAHIQGIVILEATVDEDGRVADVRLLRSANGMLDRAATAAVQQWRYSPLMLNGRATRFVLTVTLSFRLAQPSE